MLAKLLEVFFPVVKEGWSVRKGVRYISISKSAGLERKIRKRIEEIKKERRMSK